MLLKVCKRYAILTEDSIYKVRAMTATARRPAATEPTFLVAAPLKLEIDGLVVEPVPDGTTGAIGEPVAVEPEPVPVAAPEAAVPVAAAAVPVASPVEPATADDLTGTLVNALICKVWLRAYV